MPKVFIIEDDENIREIVVYALKVSGFEAEGYENGEAFFNKLEAKQPNLILLDIMLPSDDGLSILKRLRSVAKYKTLPVIMLTAKGNEFDKVKALDMGADDYVTKPFGVTELISRVNAVLRRSVVFNEQQEKLIYKGIVLDIKKHAVFTGGEAISLTYKEYELLYYLMKNTEIVLSRDKIMDAVWGYDFEGLSRTVDMHIKTLRQKLGPEGKHIKTVRNVGYKIGE